MSYDKLLSFLTNHKHPNCATLKISVPRILIIIDSFPQSTSACDRKNNVPAYSQRVARVQVAMEAVGWYGVRTFLSQLNGPELPPLSIVIGRMRRCSSEYG